MPARPNLPLPPNPRRDGDDGDEGAMVVAIMDRSRASGSFADDDELDASGNARQTHATARGLFPREVNLHRVDRHRARAIVREHRGAELAKLPGRPRLGEHDVVLRDSQFERERLGERARRGLQADSVRRRIEAADVRQDGREVLGRRDRARDVPRQDAEPAALAERREREPGAARGRVRHRDGGR